MPKDYLERTRYKARTVIFREGEHGNCGFLIEQGSVEIATNRGGQKQVLVNLQEGELFGEMALIDDERRSATAVARTDTVLVPITKAQVQERLQKADPVTRLLLKVILKRFRHTQGIVPRKGDARIGLPENAPNGIVQHANQAESTMQSAVAELTLLQDLSEGIRKGQIEVHYQPIYHIRSQRIFGFEALVRWNRRGRGYVPPDKFIPAAEEHGPILEIGRRVLAQACTDAGTVRRSWRDRLPPRFFVSVNVSARQLYDLQEVDRLIDIVQQSAIDAPSVKLELTEHVLMANPQLAAQALRRLKDAGLTLAVDDFGVGYSSLSYLHQFPIDILKIDRSFIGNMLSDETSSKIVRATIGLGKELGMDTVAEGVETIEQLQHLESCACTFAQGYLIAKPLPIQEAIPVLLEKQADASEPTASAYVPSFSCI